jgi:hypothetical protein
MCACWTLPLKALIGAKCHALCCTSIRIRIPSMLDAHLIAIVRGPGG